MKIPEIYKNIVKNNNNIRKINDTFNVSFQNEPRIDIEGISENLYNVKFLDNNQIYYESNILPGMFSQVSKRYHGNWEIQVSKFNDKDNITSIKYDPTGKNIFFDFDTQSIGDNICWIGQIERFALKYKCKIIVKSFYNYLFSELYPDWKWVNPGDPIGTYYSSYHLGYFLNDNKFNYTPKDPRECSLGETASLIMGMDYEEKRPRGIFIPNNLTIPNEIINKKYVCICTESTAGAKFWHRENGWQDVVDYLNLNGYTVVVVQNKASNLKNVIEYSGNNKLNLTNVANIINNSQFFIGLGSGLSWMAWALKKKVILISGFSKKWAEFELDCYRVINENVCNGCWNDPKFVFDKGDWWWCPINKNTENHFICSKSITSEMIIKHIKNLILNMDI